MPFLAPVAATAVGSFLVNFAVNAAIGIGANLLINKLQGKKKAASRAPGGAVLEVQYGQDSPRVVAIGKCAASGVAFYDNSFGEANGRLQRNFKISDWYTTSLERLRLDGEWVTLGTLDATLGYPVTSGQYAGLVWVKFHDGRQTTADAYLVDNANPSTRWTAAHKGIGISYITLTLDYNEETPTTNLPFRVEFLGAPLYDWRLDTSVGGSGSHRFNDVTTWEYSANPILADYCYRRGFYTGTYGSGEDVFCGMAMPSADLDLTRYAAAANICDETVDAESRYVVSIFLDATREHGDNIEDLMQSCAGMVVDGPTGTYPILGATQTPVATLTNDDLVSDAELTFAALRPESELVNSVSGTYIEEEHGYENSPYEQQTSAAAVTIDRRTLDFSLNFPMVPSKRQAEQLASIYFNENRYEATKVCTLRPKWQRLEIGDWITWTDDEDGTASRDYQILAMSVASIDADSPRIVQVTLQERHADIYAGIGVVTGPFTVFRNAEPTYLNEVANFAVIPVFMEGDDGSQTPGFRASWDAITDPTVSQILVEWYPRDQASPPTFHKYVGSDVTVTPLQEGVVASTVYKIRTRLITSPYRQTAYSAYVEATSGTLTLPSSVTILLESLAPVVREIIDQAYETAREALTRAQELQFITLETALRAETNKQQLQVELGSASAGFTEEVRVAVSATEAVAERIEILTASIADVEATVATVELAYVAGDAALASSISVVEARTNRGTASGFMAIEAEAGPSGFTTRLALAGSIVADGVTKRAGLFIDINSNMARLVLKGDQVLISNTSDIVTALFDATGTYIENAFITNLQAVNIGAGAITANEIALNGVSLGNSVKVAYSSTTTTTSTTWVAVSGMSVSPTVGANAKLLIIGIIYVTGPPTQISVQLVEDGAGLDGGDDTDYGFWGNNAEVGGGCIALCFIRSPSAGSHTYTMEWQVTSGTATARSRSISIVQLYR